MRFSFHPLAVKELKKAIKYYESKKLTLGLEFFHEIQSTIQRILQFPKAWSKMSANCRRCITQRFPYAIIYQITENKIIIIALMHLNEKPKNWETRVN